MVMNVYKDIKADFGGGRAFNGININFCNSILSRKVFLSRSRHASWF